MTREITLRSLEAVLGCALENTPNKEAAIDVLCMATRAVMRDNISHEEVGEKVVEVLDHYALKQS